METRLPALLTNLTNLTDLMVDAVFAVDADANVVFASVACERIFGYTSEEMIGKRMFDMVVPEDRERTRESATRTMLGHPQLNFENRYVRKDGQIVHIMWSARWSPADHLRIGVARDITERKRAEAMQSAIYSISEAAHAADDLPGLLKRIHQIVGILVPADNFSIALYDKEADRLNFAYHVDEYELKPETVQLAGTRFADIVLGGRSVLVAFESPVYQPTEAKDTAHVSPISWLGVPLKSRSETIGVLGLKSYQGGARYSEQHLEMMEFLSIQVATVIERQQMLFRLQYMAQYDPLTALPNRGFFYDRLKVALATMRREKGRLALLFLDLDKFKQVNDTLGHHVGDLLLQQFGNRLRRCVRESDTVARVGGDEFVVLLQHITSPEQVERIAKKIRASMNEPFVIEGHTVTMATSIGIAHAPEHGEDEEQLLRKADNAMYSEKKSTS